MNIDFYRNYIEIVERGTLSAAARSLHVAQSALSNQLKQFEEDYRTQLFIRSSRQMEPTDAGKLLYKRAKDIIALVDASYKEIDSFVDGAQGILRIGMTQAYPDTYMTQLLLAFQKQHENIRFEFYEQESHQIFELLRSGVIEVGVARSPGLLPPFLQDESELSEDVCLYVRKDNPWIDANQETLPVKMLADVPLAISRGIMDFLDDMFEREDISPKIISVSTSRSNPMMWADNNVAAAVIRTGNAENMNDDEHVCLTLTSDNPIVKERLTSARTFLTLKDGVLSAAAKRFVEFSKEYNKTHEQ